MALRIGWKAVLHENLLCDAHGHGHHESHHVGHRLNLLERSVHAQQSLEKRAAELSAMVESERTQRREAEERAKRAADSARRSAEEEASLEAAAARKAEEARAEVVKEAERRGYMRALTALRELGPRAPPREAVALCVAARVRLTEGRCRPGVSLGIGLASVRRVFFRRPLFLAQAPKRWLLKGPPFS